MSKQTVTLTNTEIRLILIALIDVEEEGWTADTIERFTKLKEKMAKLYIKWKN